MFDDINYTIIYIIIRINADVQINKLKVTNSQYVKKNYNNKY